MGDIAVRAEKLAKSYWISTRQRAAYDTARDQISATVSAAWRRLTGRADPDAGRSGRSLIWALDDVSFEINHGETVGIIGRNGAGKSTLLKVLSRITEPSRGRAAIYGRVGSLLEVGTGFHPELSGRENVFLNGAILGLRRAEITRKFDEIVAFAEIEQFIDTPVKFYSSGMYMRLAFAVAAHMEPDILIVDEVLSVGDIRFQRKCLNLLQDAGSVGRTVLFVSHNMSAINRLCERAILIERGRIAADGPAQRIAATYLSAGQGTNALREWEPEHAPGGTVARLLAVRLRDETGALSDQIAISRPLSVELEYEVLQGGYQLLPHFHLANEEGLRVFTSIDVDPEWRQRARPAGRYVSRAQIPGNLLNEGVLSIHPCMRTLSPSQEEFSVRSAASFQVIDTYGPDTARGDWAGNIGGVIRPRLEWMTEYHPAVASIGQES